MHAKLKVYIKIIDLNILKHPNMLNITCTGHPRCWGVGTLLIRVRVLGNEALENRNGRHKFTCEEMVELN